MADNGTVSQPIMSEPKQERFSEHKAMTRAAGVVGFWTTLSRILGFVRDMVIALFMGAGPGADTFLRCFPHSKSLAQAYCRGRLFTRPLSPLM